MRRKTIVFRIEMIIATLYLSDLNRDYIIKNHNLLLEQFTTRILPHFDEDYIEEEMEKYADDQGLYGDSGHERQIDFGIDLMEMRNRLILSGLVILYHNWEKVFFEFIEFELLKKYFKKPLSMFDLLNEFEWNIKTQEFYNNLNLLRLVVNVFKHGDGPSYEKLKKLKPIYFPVEHYACLEINMDEFKKLADSIEKFWCKFPKDLNLDVNQLKH